MSPRPYAISHQPLAMAASLNIPILVDRLCYRYPSILVDAVTEHEEGRRLVAVRNVTINEEFFAGHFPTTPVMPAVLMLESWSQVAAMLVLAPGDAPPDARVYLRGVNDAKFRRQVVPGDRVRLEICLGRRRTPLTRAQASAYVGDQKVAEAELVLGVVLDTSDIDPTAVVDSGARIGQGTVVGPHAVVGPNVRIGRNCRIGASCVVEGWTEIGDDCENMARLGGHVTVEDYVNISAGSGVHQFCRVGRHAFIGGYSVVTKDALPFARTVGSRPARIYGVNTIGLMRRGFTQDVVTKLKRSFRYLIQSKLNTTRA